MRRLTTALFVATAAIAPLAACSASWGDDDGKPGIAPTGSGGERHYAASGFDSVGLGTSADVEVRIGNGYSVVATGTPAALDMLKVRLDGRGLDLGAKRGMHWGGSDKVHFTITMPRIAAASIGGSGTITVDRVEGHSFDGNIGGSGNLDIRGMRVDTASFAIGGSGNIAAAGHAGKLSVSIGGSGKIRSAPLTAETADITIAGAGNIQATVKRTASVTIVGSGDVTIGGGAKCSVTKMGSGNVHCS